MSAFRRDKANRPAPHQPSPTPFTHANPDDATGSTTRGDDRPGPEVADEVRVEYPGLDRQGEVQRPWQDTHGDDAPLIVRVQVRIVTGWYADAVRAAQGHALRALLAALTSGNTEPIGNHHHGKDDR